ncbi:hypothetical protein [Variovorax sp. HJSM1_2]|uniref:hypothetical protein n=1 Tax=Variovorax sp. HJSM1_2 TaxID=3366263 RepID=UPI003BE794E9
MTGRGLRHGCMLLLMAATPYAWSQTAPACPAPEDILPQHLFGSWTGQIQGQPEQIRILFTKHPEFAGSVSGTLERAGIRAHIAGDVDHGDFTLEESLDGQRINATWLGQVEPNSCGKEITGTWTQENDSNSARAFVLRKQPGW